MLSDNEQYVQRGVAPGREAIPPSQYGSLGSRRQSARPTAPPPLASNGYPNTGPQLSHPFAQRQPQDLRGLEGYSLTSSESSSSQHSQYLPRQVPIGDAPVTYSRGSVSSRRPMNPPILQLPPEPTASHTSHSSGSSTVGRPSPAASVNPTSPLSPPRQSGTRPSSRRALVAALSLAQEAVKLDTAGNDPQAAVDAYARSVVLLREVMSRVSSGESASSSSTPNGQSSSRSLTPREEEVRRLKSIVSQSQSAYSHQYSLISLS